MNKILLVLQIICLASVVYSGYFSIVDVVTWNHIPNTFTLGTVISSLVAFLILKLFGKKMVAKISKKKSAVLKWFKRYLFEKLDKIAAIIGAIFALALTVFIAFSIGRLVYISVGVLLFLACIGYLIIRRSLTSSWLTSFMSKNISKRLQHLLNIIFFVLFAFSILCVLLRPNHYIRPLAYFISIAIMVGVVAVEIMFLPLSKSFTYSTLFKIAMIGSNLVLTQLLLFPGVLGIDPWWHRNFTLKILDTGYISGGTGYSNLPMMHLFIGETSLATGLNYKIATIFSISLLQVFCNMLFTFLLGNFLFNKKVGLLGSLLLVTANWHINFSFWAIPNTMASIFVLPIVYLFLKVRRDYFRLSLIVGILLMGTSILSHTITAVFITIVLFVSWVVFKLYEVLYHQRKIPVTFIIPILYLAGMLFWWDQVSGDIVTFGELIDLGFAENRFASPAPSGIVQYTSRLPFSEQIFSNLGLFLFFAFSIIGCFYMVSRKFGNSRTSIIATGGIVPLSLGFFALLTGKGIIEHRWWYFSQLFLALPLAVALFLLCFSIKNKVGKSLLLMGLTISLTFLMVVSPIADLDNPVMTEDITIRYALTESELQAMERVSSGWNKEIGTDWYYSKVYSLSYSTEDIGLQFYSGNYSEVQDMFILIRKEILTNPFRIGAYTYKLNSNPQEALDYQGFSRVYDCGSVSGYVKSNNATDLES